MGTLDSWFQFKVDEAKLEKADTPTKVRVAINATGIEGFRRQIHALRTKLNDLQPHQVNERLHLETQMHGLKSQLANLTEQTGTYEIR